MKKRLINLTMLGILTMPGSWVYGVVPPPAVPEHTQTIVKTPYDDKIVIANTKVFGTLEYPAVVFDHDKHTQVLEKEGKTCSACHPRYGKHKDVISFTFPKGIRDLRTTTPKELMHAYHAECMGCHEKRYKEHKKAGPVTCGSCHVKGVDLSKFTYPPVDFDFKLHDTHLKKLQAKQIEEVRAKGMEQPVVVRFEHDNLDPAQEVAIEKKAGEKNCALCHHSYDKEQKKLVYEIVYDKGREIDRAWACEDCHEPGARPSPLLAADISLTTHKDLPMEKAAHIRCLNCHLLIARDEGADKAGPVLCYKCHERKAIPARELARVPRPKAGQPATCSIDIRDAGMKSVPFDHEFHEQHVDSCRACHHETLYSCDRCHTLRGNANGNGISIFDAYHDSFSQKSCIGCHRTEETAKDCSGCHHASIVAQEPTRQMCSRCHSGQARVAMPPTMTTAGLNRERVKNVFQIKVLENQFKPVKYPHEKILVKLAEVSNSSKLATYFHGNIQTLCAGCHHHGAVGAQIHRDVPPSCSHCHSRYFEPLRSNRPRLLAAYHEMCIQCHRHMDLKKPKACTECHAFAKKGQPQAAAGNNEPDTK